jgi:Bacteriophage tail sheath protein
MAILDLPATEQRVQDAVDYRRTTLNLSSSYSALYSCDVLILDQYTGRRLYVPPSGYVGACYALTDRNYAVWFAPAGLFRGKLTVLGIRNIYNQGDRDTLVQNEINPIRVISGVGIAVWGADTLQTKKSSLSNVNVRRLMLYLEKSLSQTALYSVFNPNDSILRSRLQDIADRFLQQIKDGEGLYGFGVVCDDSNNTPATIANGDLIMDIYVDPVLPAKRILLTAVITKTGARFVNASETAQAA